MAKLCTYTYGIYIDFVMFIPKLLCMWFVCVATLSTTHDMLRNTETRGEAAGQIQQQKYPHHGGRHDRKREREREGRRLPYRTPQGWDYLLHQSAIAQQKRTGNNTVKPSVCLITRSSIKYNSSSQPECTTGISPGICSVKIKSYMRSYKIFIYML